MSFAREKRWLLGLLALLAPIPLPLNDVLSWPVLALFSVAVLLFLRRVRQDATRWLPNWAMNVLALAYLPFAFLDYKLFSHGTVVRPTLHLLLFVLVARLFSLTRERDKWQAMVTIFFLFLAAMATSTHPTVLLYLLAFVVLALLLLTRFAFFHILTSFGHRDPAPALVPLWRFLVLATLGTLALTTPLFATLPRIPAYYLPFRGFGNGTGADTVGFSDTVQLDSIGRTRDNPQVVLRLHFRRRPPASQEVRLKVDVHESFVDGAWQPSPGEGESVTRLPGRSSFQLAELPAVNDAEIRLEPVLGNHLALPVETVEVDLRSVAAWDLYVASSGMVRLPQRPRSAVSYQVALAAYPLVLSAPPASHTLAANLDPRGITPEIRRLAAEVMGQGTAEERVTRLEQYFLGQFEYTTEFLSQGNRWTLADFLTFRKGHCEYFATAMTLMLRAEGIPARLVTGFVGGEFTPFDDDFILRQRNAHAWVEAYVEGVGWEVRDPTPPSGRPSVTRIGVLGLFGRAYGNLVESWDRFIIDYGANDQFELLQRLRAMLDEWRSRLTGKPHRSRAKGTTETVAASEAAPSIATARPWWPYAVPVVLGLATSAAFALRRRQQRRGAVEIYGELRRRVEKRGLTVPPSLAPLAFADAVAARFPALAPTAGRIVALYLAESFGGRALDPGERQDLAAALEEAIARLAKPGSRTVPTATLEAPGTT